jgi:hypothetical protein
VKRPLLLAVRTACNLSMSKLSCSCALAYACAITTDVQKTAHNLDVTVRMSLFSFYKAATTLQSVQAVSVRCHALPIARYTHCSHCFCAQPLERRCCCSAVLNRAAESVVHCKHSADSSVQYSVLVARAHPVALFLLKAAVCTLQTTCCSTMTHSL